MATIGAVNKIPRTICEFEWTIPSYLLLSQKSEQQHFSPSFVFASNAWRLSILPNGTRVDDTVGWIGIYLWKMSSDSPISLDFSFGLKTLDCEKDQAIHCKNFFERAGSGYGNGTYLLRNELLKRKVELLPSGVLTILCTIKHPIYVKDASTNVTTQCSFCKESLVAENVSSHEKKCMNKPIKCPECCDVIALRNWYDHECQTAKKKGDVSLKQYYKKVLLDGKDHNLILKIGGKKLRAHQDILRSRSTVFESMLTHDMMEKNSGVIDIPDCDPETMELFLLYMYCGELETLDQSNMLRLYYIADKYDVEDLKEECCNFIKKSLSYTNICHVIQLALNHSDSNLLEYATEYFKDNALDIMHTVEWQCFLEDNYVAGNELLIKSFGKK